MSQEKKNASPPNFRVLLAAGGTGGHLLPAQMVAQDLLERNCRVLFAGSGLKKSPIFDQNRFEFHEVVSATLSIKKPFRLFSAMVLLCKGVYESLRLLRSFKPRVVVGFGSYHSFPLLLAAFLTKTPFVIFQPDRTLGRTNRFFAKKAKRIALQFPLEKQKFDSVAFVPLLPWKQPAKILSKEEAREKLGLKKDLFTLLIFGGSQGAKAINDLVPSTLQKLQEHGILFQLIHLTGDLHQEAFYESSSFPHYARPFEKNMIPLLQAADLAICRAGASTCAELITFELPFLLIPYPHAEAHQVVNARYLQEEVKGGEMLLQQTLSSERLFQSLCQKREMLSYHKEKIKEYKKNRGSLREKPLWEIICQAGGGL
jgi:UDP-N-acetylglucosamine--N-acetylmuramyl-(pentapeptide) pyrophosphoryl-undecaprenol N-acetylglucosamine transferase